MDRIPYYFETPGAYPKAATRIVANGATSAPHETLEGAIQEFLDGMHLILADNAGSNAVPLDGVLAQQANLSYVLAQIDAYARFYPRFYLDSVPDGKTADAIATQYKAEATKLFAAYGLS